MASLRSRFWRSIIRKVFKEQGLSVPEERARTRKTSKVHVPFPKEIRIERFDIDGMSCAAISPVGAIDRRVVLYLHGGGYVTGSIDASLMLCVPMARTLGMKILLPEYRLAPEHPFPAALDDALKAYRWMLAHDYAPSEIVVAGDSAGAGLCLALVQALRTAGVALPVAVLCLSPWADLSHSGYSHASNAASDIILRTDMLTLWASYYAGATSLDDPLVSAAFADFSGFPPLLLLVDSSEILLDDSIQIEKKARAAGVDVSLSLWDGLWHVWPALGNLIPESREAFEQMREFLDARRPG